jgi:hypothetical protein
LCLTLSTSDASTSAFRSFVSLLRTPHCLSLHWNICCLSFRPPIHTHVLIHAQLSPYHFRLNDMILHATSRYHMHIYENTDVPHLSRQASVLPYTLLCCARHHVFLPIKTVAILGPRGSSGHGPRDPRGSRPIHFLLHHLKRGSLSGVGRQWWHHYKIPN